MFGILAQLVVVVTTIGTPAKLPESFTTSQPVNDGLIHHQLFVLKKIKKKKI